MVWNGMEDDFSIFHTGNFLPFHFHSLLKIFLSIFNFSSIFHSILSYQEKFRPEAMRNFCCTFTTLSVILPLVAHEGKQYRTIHLIPYLKHYRNDLPVPLKLTQHKYINHNRSQDFWFGRGGAKQKSHAMTKSNIFKRWDFNGSEIP